MTDDEIDRDGVVITIENGYLVWCAEEDYIKKLVIENMYSNDFDEEWNLIGLIGDKVGAMPSEQTKRLVTKWERLNKLDND
jgi:hypothetical protein